METTKILTEIKAEKEKKVSQLIEDCLMFFAFSNEQFTANKTHLEPDEKYVHLGAGAYMPKGKVNVYLDGIKAINKWYKAEVKNNKVRKDNILYELNNYECFYTYDIKPALDALGSNYTLAEVRKVFNSEIKKITVF